MKNNSPNERDRDRLPTEINRRKLLGAISVGGLGIGTTLHGMTETVDAAQDEATIIQGTERNVLDDGSVEIIPIQKTVPKTWYEDLVHARNVFTNQNERLLNSPGVSETTLSAGRYNGRNAIIRVKVSKKAARRDGISLAEAEDNIPPAVDGVKVVTKRAPDPCACDSDADAGEEVYTGDGTGTCGGRAYKNGDPHIMTAEHLWEGNPDTLYRNGETIGDAEEWDCYDDFAACRPINGWFADDYVKGTGEYIDGQMSEAGIWDLEAKGETVCKTGITTGETHGEVHGIGSAWVYDSNCNNRDKQVKWGDHYDFADGDSGSLAYKMNYDGKDWAVSLCCCESDIVFGTGCFHIYDLHGYHWD